MQLTGPASQLSQHNVKRSGVVAWTARVGAGKSGPGRRLQFHRACTPLLQHAASRRPPLGSWILAWGRPPSARSGQPLGRAFVGIDNVCILLTRVGREGWELVAHTKTVERANRTFTWTFKRPVP